MGDVEQRQVRVMTSMADIDAAAWDKCADPTYAACRDGHFQNPFVSHAFLSALEDSQAACIQTGWAPQHLLLEGPSGEITGAMPCYLKTHSRGEYVFDSGWAEAYERAGGHYYPKLQCAVPFTPVTGPRLLVPEGPGKREHQRLLIAAALQLVERYDLSSLHITFATRNEWEAFGGEGLLQRTDRQFFWRNEGYENFEDFLSALASRKRKALRKERKAALSAGLDVERITGSDLTETHWDVFFEFYMDTGARKWGTPYLNREAFSLLGERLADHLLLVLAKRDGKAIAGALNVIGADTLYGRYWGASEFHKFLHFELCYYQAIDYAIAHGLKRVEAGAQGSHKLARGYLPHPTYSLHHIADPGFRQAVAHYLEGEQDYVDAEADELAACAPFKKE